MLTRKMLKAMGIEEDVIEQIIDAHTETVDALKKQRDGYKADADKAGELGEELKKVRKQLKEAEANTEYDELETKYNEEHKELEKLQKANEKLQSEFDEYKEQAKASESKRVKTDAYRSLLEKAGIAQKYVSAVLRISDLDGLELDDEGNVKDADKVMEKVKSEYPEFVSKTETKGAETENPPAKNPTAEGVSARAQKIIQEHYEKKYGKSEE